MSAIRERPRNCKGDTTDSNSSQWYLSGDKTIGQCLICATCLTISQFVIRLIIGILTLFGYSTGFWILLVIETRDIVLKS